MSIDLIDSHLKSRQLGNFKFDNFDDVFPKLLNYFSKNKVTDWSKPGCRTTYNNIKIFEILGFNVTVSKIKNKTKAKVSIKYKDTSAKILVRLQDYFQYKVVEYLKDKSETNPKLKHFFKRHQLLDSDEIQISSDEFRYNIKNEADNDLVNDKEFAIEDKTYCDFNNYRVDMLLHISGKYYLCLEFFENHHKNPNEVDLSNELHRIMSLVYNNKSRTKKIIHVGVFWESEINNKLKFEQFMDKVVIEKIEKYSNIENEKDYIISAIAKELDCPFKFAEMLYNSNENRNKPIVPVEELEKVINWKDDYCKSKILKKFYKKVILFSSKDDTDSEINLDDEINENNKENDKENDKELKVYYDEETKKLSNYGLTLYLSFIITNNVLNTLEDEEMWNEFNAKIMQGFINGLKKIRQDSLMLTDNFMSGLYDCY